MRGEKRIPPGSALVASKEALALDHLDDRLRNEFLPGGVVGLDEVEDVVGPDTEHVFVEVADVFDQAVFEQVSVEIFEFGSDGKVLGGDDIAGIEIEAGVDVEAAGVSEQLAEACEDAAFFGVVEILVEDFPEFGGAEREGDGSMGITGEIAGEAVEAEKIGDQNGFAEDAERIGAGEEILFIDVLASAEVAQGHFHEDDGFFALDIRGLGELFGGAFEDVEGGIGNGMEAAALDEDGFFVNDFGPLDGFAFGGEHGGFGEAFLDQEQGHETVVDLGEGGAAELDHVDFDAFPGEVIEERADEGRGGLV